MASEIGGSCINVRMRVSGPLIMRFMMLFMAGVMRKGVWGDLQNFIKILDKQELDVKQ